MHEPLGEKSYQVTKYRGWNKKKAKEMVKRCDH